MPPVYETLLLNTAVPQIQAAQTGDSYVMVVNATTPALRITQTGTGNAISVEDEANPDATPFVVSAAGDVGIGTNAPAVKLDVNGDARVGGTSVSQSLLTIGGSSTSAAINLRGALGSAYAWQISSNSFIGSALEFTRSTAVGGTTFSSPSMLLTSTGTLNIVGAGTAGSTQAISFNGSTPVDTLVTTSTGVGIGAPSPAYKLEVNGGASDAMSLFNSTNANGAHLRFAASGTVKSFIGGAPGFLGSGTADDLGIRAVGSVLFATNGSSVDMTLDTSGNLGLGVTPSAWDAAGAGGPVLQIQRALLFGANTETRLIHNAYYGTGDFRYIASGVAATNYQQASGQHRWFTAPSGTANDPITFTQAMTLDASGNWLLGKTSAGATGGVEIIPNVSSLSFGRLYLNSGYGAAANSIVFAYAGTSVGIIQQGTASTSYFTNGSAGSGLVGVDANTLGFNTGGTERARITSGGDLQIANGNLVMSTSGKGIDFAATAGPTNGTMTSELLNDYEEGTWTPTDQSGAGLTFTVDYATYTKVGRAVSIQGSITYPSTASGLTALFGGFPFTAANSIQMSVIYSDASVASFTYLSGNTSNVFPLIPGANVTNATLSGKIVIFAGTYFV